MALPRNAIRLVTFDALYTILAPRAPIPVQYAEAFATAGLGTLDPSAVERSFKEAYKHATATLPPGHGKGDDYFWSRVISRAATGAGADVEATEAALPTLVPTLMNRFSTGEAYTLYNDVMSSLERLHAMGLRSGLISNSDSRILSVLTSLGALEKLRPALVSAVEKVEKPNADIFELAAARAGVEMYQTVHVGDELECDYKGAERAGMKSLLLRRRGKDNVAAHLDSETEDLKGVTVVRSLTEAVDWIEAYNQQKDTWK